MHPPRTPQGQPKDRRLDRFERFDRFVPALLSILAALLNNKIGPRETYQTYETYNIADTANAPRGTLMDPDQEIIEALRLAQATLNPLSGFLRKGTPTTRRYIETVCDQINAVLAKMTTRAAPLTGEVIKFPRPLAQPGKRPSWGALDKHGGDTPDAA